MNPILNSVIPAEVSTIEGVCSVLSIVHTYKSSTDRMLVIFDIDSAVLKDSAPFL